MVQLLLHIGLAGTGIWERAAETYSSSTSTHCPGFRVREQLRRWGEVQWVLPLLPRQRVQEVTQLSSLYWGHRCDNNKFSDSGRTKRDVLKHRGRTHFSETITNLLWKWTLNGQWKKGHTEEHRAVFMQHYSVLIALPHGSVGTHSAAGRVRSLLVLCKDLMHFGPPRSSPDTGSILLKSIGAWNINVTQVPNLTKSSNALCDLFTYVKKKKCSLWTLTNCWMTSESLATGVHVAKRL